MTQEFNEVLDRLKETNQLLRTLLPDPKVPEDLKGNIRKNHSLNQKVIDGAERLRNAKS